MPVSKKRKKDGKPARRPQPAAEAIETHPDAKAGPRQQMRIGQPKNPFVTQQQAKRGAQRGR